MKTSAYAFHQPKLPSIASILNQLPAVMAARGAVKRKAVVLGHDAADTTVGTPRRAALPPWTGDAFGRSARQAYEGTAGAMPAFVARGHVLRIGTAGYSFRMWERGAYYTSSTGERAAFGLDFDAVELGVTKYIDPQVRTLHNPTWVVGLVQLGGGVWPIGRAIPGPPW
jgi:hypothetical protein